jgi:hypothetical protein
VLSSQTLSEADRRIVAAWAADCSERVLGWFEAEAPGDERPRDAINRARAFARGELAAADEIRWQLLHLTPDARAALAAVPLLGEDAAGPLGPGLLSSGALGAIIRTLQAGINR